MFVLFNITLCFTGFMGRAVHGAARITKYSWYTLDITFLYPENNNIRHRA